MSPGYALGALHTGALAQHVTARRGASSWIPQIGTQAGPQASAHTSSQGHRRHFVVTEKTIRALAPSLKTHTTKCACPPRTHGPWLPCPEWEDATCVGVMGKGRSVSVCVCVLLRPQPQPCLSSPLFSWPSAPSRPQTRGSRRAPRTLPVCKKTRAGGGDNIREVQEPEDKRGTCRASGSASAEPLFPNLGSEVVRGFWERPRGRGRPAPPGTFSFSPRQRVVFPDPRISGACACAGCVW